jgi:hypothetical protein
MQEATEASASTQVFFAFRPNSGMIISLVRDAAVTLTAKTNGEEPKDSLEDFFSERPNPWSAPKRLQVNTRTASRSIAMKLTVTRYQTKPQAAQENERLIKQVFQELQAGSPAGVRYIALRLDDNTFIHFSTVEEGDTPY